MSSELNRFFFSSENWIGHNIVHDGDKKNLERCSDQLG